VSLGPGDTAHGIASRIHRREVSAEAVTAAALERIRTQQATLNCFTTVLEEQALDDARRIDVGIESGADAGPLAGVPFGVKDLFDVEGIVTLAGSKILASNPPAFADATLVRRMRQAGGILVGCQNMDEFAYGFTTENAHYGTTHNPHDPARVAGGSSGGSAASVAAGLVALSLGSDTNGSIRVPASYCGIFGLKPTFGRLPRTGTFPFVHELDHLGPFARDVRDLALTYDVLQGHDSGDESCDRRPADSSCDRLDAGITDIRAGVLGEWFEEGASDEALDAVGKVARALGKFKRVALPEARRARAAAFCITCSAGAAWHRERLRARPQDFDPATRDRFFAGLMLPESVVAQAHRLRAWFARAASSVFNEVDILLAPATPDVAPLIGQPTMNLGGRQVPTRPNIGIYTQPISFIGLPVVCVPLWTTRGLPIGVQIIAPPWQETLALRVAFHLEREGIVFSRSSIP
jgi:AtzE family amidohydrolase